jgi:hypothetical protein
MKMRMVLLVMMLALPITGWAQNVRVPEPPENIYVHMRVTSMLIATAPQIWQNYFILSYKSAKIPRFVAVAFEHENYQVLHSFLRNEANVFVYYANLPEVSELRYRLIVDGVWMEDPTNDNQWTDNQGVTLSILPIPTRPITASGPIYRGDGFVDFYLSATPSAQVFLNGNFSRWEPFLYPMNEISPGMYHLRLQIGTGRFYYYFRVNGIRTLDSGNFSTATFLGDTVSTWSTDMPPVR